MFRIGPYSIATPVALAPMAGITDKPFRRLARRFGAGYAVSEMLASDPSLRHTKKSLSRGDFDGEDGLRAVQIAGSDPKQMAEAARYNVENGAQIIDINMGCPVKKVCNVLAGSALLQNEKLVGDILRAVVSAVDVPVTLKTRLGFAENNKNIRTVAKMAEQAGIAALAVHGRTREQMYKRAGLLRPDCRSQTRHFDTAVGKRRHHHPAKSRRGFTANGGGRRDDRARRARPALAVCRHCVLPAARQPALTRCLSDGLRRHVGTPAGNV